MKSTTTFKEFLGGILLLGFALTGQALAGTWETKDPMPTAVVFAAGGVIDGKLYIAGGGPPAGFSTTLLQIYDPLSDTWDETKAPMPTPRSASGSGVINDKLYVVGGCILSDCRIGTTNVVEVYDPATDTWTTAAPMPTPRSFSAVGIIDGKMYVAAGLTACPPCGPQPAALEVYDPATNSWSIGESIPTPREGAVGAVVNGKLYVIGGFVRPSNTLSDAVEIYDPATNMWTIGAPMPTLRNIPAGAAIGGLIHVVGGHDNVATFLDTHEVYNPATDTWSAQTSMSVPRYGLVAGVIDAKLYAAGGTNSSGNVGTLEVFTPADTIAPVLDLPGNIAADATSPAGAVVSYTATATDNSGVAPTVDCTPASGSTFPAGVTTVNCVATDGSENSSNGNFTVTVNGPSAQVSNLISVVQSFNLERGISNSLTSKLEDALAQLASGNVTDACNLLNAFINQASAQSGKKLTSSQAAYLIESANRIRAAQGCS